MYYLLLNIAMTLKLCQLKSLLFNILTEVISVIQWHLFSAQSIKKILLWFKWKILQKEKKKGPSITLYICVSPPVCLQIFWMGVLVALAHPQTRQPRWKECRPPPVTLPSHPSRTFPLSDHGHQRRIGASSQALVHSFLLSFPMPSKHGFCSSHKLSCYI